MSQETQIGTMLSSDPMCSRMHEGGPHKQCDNKVKENGGGWYFSRKEIEENSASRSDGIDLKKETYLRKSYCTFLQDLGMRLEVPQVTIATAIIFCHRFFLRQSHAKNDRRTIATVCMFLAGKVEETPHPLKDVILVSYKIIHKRNPEALHRIKQKEVYEQQKEIILIGERLVLTTLAFDFTIHHPYKPLIDSIKKFKAAQPDIDHHALAQVAWNFVNDGLRTSICLQFKAYHIGAGAIFLAAKFLKVKLASNGDKVWWQEFNVTPQQLEEVSNQMLELYELNRVPPSQTSEVVDGSTGGSGVTPKSHEEYNTDDSSSHVGLGPTTSDHPRTSRSQSNDDGSTTDHNKEIPSDVENNEDRNHESDQNPEYRFRSPKEAVKKMDKDKVRAAFEKRRKGRGGDATQRTEFMDDDDDLIERELEDGTELGGESEKRKRNWSNEVVEEGEVGLLDDGGDGLHRLSPPPDKRRKLEEC